MSERLAIMKEVDIGMRDVNRPVLWFTVRMNDCLAALIVLSWEEAGKLLEDAGVYSVKNLEGQACYVDAGEGWGDTVRFLRVAKI